MISVEKYFEIFKSNDIRFFTGVPDSLLKNFVSYVADQLDFDDHVITANEGASIAVASGYHLATGKIPVVYMQNSGLGNTINPLLSLASDDVYKIPLLLLIGWRGEPGVKDEPQHVMQGKVTLELLKAMNIPYVVVGENEEETFNKTQGILDRIKHSGVPHAIVVKKGVFNAYSLKNGVDHDFEMSREDALKIVINGLNKKDIVVSTTGKLSRELFEYRAQNALGHETDFLTVGSMGHASMIALGVAREKKHRTVFCLDGDGALLMHAGSLSNIGNSGLKNYKHIVFNNGAHESVGGQETLALKIDLPLMAKSCGYSKVYSVSTAKKLTEVLESFGLNQETSFLEIKVKIDTRSNLGRPTTTPIENKIGFMNNLKSDD